MCASRTQFAVKYSNRVVIMVKPRNQPIDITVAVTSTERLHLKMCKQELPGNRCYSAILEGYFNGSDWGECDFVCTISSPQ